jgi:hypothetical protein
VTGATPVEREAVDVMFIRTQDDPADMRRGWNRLEGLVGLHGRKFYGAYFPETREYHVCVESQQDDDAAAIGLESATLPGAGTCASGCTGSRRRCTSGSGRRSRSW